MKLDASKNLKKWKESKRMKRNIQLEIHTFSKFKRERDILYFINISL